MIIRAKKVLFISLFSTIFLTVATFAAESCPVPTISEPSSDVETTPVTTSDISTCDSTRAALKKYLLDNGYSETSTAAIMGNIGGESGYRTNVIEGGRLVDESFRAYDGGKKTYSGGFGLAQWTSAGRVKKLQEYADSIGKPVVSFEAQAGYLVKELASYKFAPSRLNSKSLDEATWLILRDYETPRSVICFTTSTNPSNQCNGLSKKNTLNPRNVSYATLSGNSSQYALAWSSFSSRRTKAKGNLSISVSSCSTTSGGSSSGGSPSESPSGTPSSGSASTETSTPTVTPTPESSSTPTPTGAVGKSSASGYYVQTSGAHAKLRWRKNDTSGTPTISESGCSLVAVSNALKALGRDVSPSTIASWSVNNVTSAGWGASVAPISSHFGLRLTSYLFSSVSTSRSTKEKYIRDALAAGRPVILSGARNDVSEYSGIDCKKSSNISAGKCVFSKNGHFITIIGIDSSGRAIVANPANGSNGAYSLEEILKTAKYAKAAY